MADKKYNSGRRKKRRRQRNRRVFLAGILLLGVLFGICVWKTERNSSQEELQEKNDSFIGAPPFDVELLDINEYSRPGIPLEKINGIVVHYTANPGSTAEDNRNYFQNLKDSHETKVSSHFVIGIDGQIVQCIPSSEMAYATNERNSDTLSIECCHKDESGEFTEETYRSLVRLTGWLCQRFGLSSGDVIRHYDVTGKNCPRYYVEYPEAWETFRKDVDEQIQIVEEEVREAGKAG